MALELLRVGTSRLTTKATRNGTCQGLLSYLGTRALENTAAPELSTVEPATSSYRDEL